MIERQRGREKQRTRAREHAGAARSEMSSDWEKLVGAGEVMDRIALRQESQRAREVSGPASMLRRRSRSS